MKTTTPIYEIFSERLATEEAICHIKTCFEQHLKKELNLFRVSAPMIVLQGTGINDDLSGKERAVQFPLKGMNNQTAEVVQSLAKWKRLQLEEYDFPAGTGIITDMKALRADEELSPIHSVYVDQWDWELSISEEERSLSFLKQIVRKIFASIKVAEQSIAEKFPEKFASLPDEITFVHAEDLLRRFPNSTPKERENKIAKEFGAVFLIGIGGKLSNGEPHDFRAPDYDDWSIPTEKEHSGLNGDILFWNPVLEKAFEISSMGIRVNAEALQNQLDLTGQQERKKLFYHSSLLKSKFRDSIGGGIGQSRLCMFLLKKRHIGEVQVSIWPDTIRESCKSNAIKLL